MASVACIYFMAIVWCCLQIQVCSGQVTVAVEAGEAFEGIQKVLTCRYVIDQTHVPLPTLQGMLWRNESTYIVAYLPSVGAPIYFSMYNELEYIISTVDINAGCDLTIQSVSQSDNGMFTCEVYVLDPTSHSYSNSTLLTVSIIVPPTTITITYDGVSYNNGDSITVVHVDGDNHQFTCNTPGVYPDTTFTWTLPAGSTTNQPLGTQTSSPNADISLVDSSNTVTITILVNQATSQLTCGATNREDGSTYTEVDITVTLQVKVKVPPKMVKLSDSSGDIGASLAVNQGTLHSLQCLVQGTRPAASIQWLLANVAPSTGVGDPTSTEINGLWDTTGSWSFIPSRIHHKQEVKCEASTAESTAPFPSDTVTIDVNGPPNTPVITGTSLMTEDVSTTLTCTADLAFPVGWSLVWSNEGTLIPGPTQSAELTTDQRYNFTSTVNFTPMRGDNGNTIKCSAQRASWTSNSEGSWGPLNVQYEANITNKADNEEVAQDGDDANLECITEGNPIPTIMWYSPDNTVITSDMSKYTVNYETTGGDSVFEYIVTSTLTIHRVDSQVDYGQYTCITSNGIGAKDSLKINLTRPRRPNKPTIVRVTDRTADSLTVRWTAGYDGGKDQWFHVGHLKPGGPETISEKTTREDYVYIVNGLDAYTEYEIRVYAENDIGMSTDYGETTTKTLPNPPGSGLVIEFNTDEGTVEVEGLGSKDGCIQIEVQYTGSSDWSKCGDCITEDQTVTLDQWCPKPQQTRRKRAVGDIADVRTSHCQGGLCSEPVTAKKVTTPPNSNIGVIVGVIVGVVLLIGIFVLGFCAGRKFKRLTKDEATSALSKVKVSNYQLKRAQNNYLDATEMDVINIPVQCQESATYANVSTAHKAFPRDQLHITQELGHGAFGRVLLAKVTGIIGGSEVTLVAVKTLKDGALSTDKADMMQELDLMKKLPDHPNVVKLLGFCVEQDPLYIIVEYLSRGCLKDLLKDSRSKGGRRVYGNLHGISKSLTSKDLMKFAKDTAEGMAFISSQKCIHRDLAARNVLVAEDMTCKVSDFGLARDVMNIRVYGKLPFRWMALESIIDDVYTTESDVWSFGVLLWEIVTLGSRPYPGMAAQMMISKLQCGYRMSKPQHCQDELYQMMLRCWQENPENRPTFKKIGDEIQQLIHGGKECISIRDFQETIYEVTLQHDANEKV